MLVYDEPDDGFFLSVTPTESQEFITISAGNGAQSEYYTIPASNPAAAPTLFSPREEELEIADLQRAIQNLVIGRFAMCQSAGKRMLAQGSGSIMNIGSLASVTALGRSTAARRARTSRISCAPSKRW